MKKVLAGTIIVLVVATGTAGAIGESRAEKAAACGHHIASVLDDEYSGLSVDAEISVMSVKCLRVGAKVERWATAYTRDGFSYSELVDFVAPRLFRALARSYGSSVGAIAAAY